ncbi:MAG: DNA polymerase III subunit delta [Caulobacterales bacterium]|nr:DNA polymerase III subunit delta [Caulobacterales bacterium]
MILKRRPDIDRFLGRPDPAVRAILIYGRDRGVVRERGEQLARALVPDIDDPFDTALLTDGDLESDPARLEDELAAQSMLGGRRLVRLRLHGEKASVDRLAAEALVAHVEARLNPDAAFVIEAGILGRDSALRKAAEKADAACVIPCYEDEIGDTARMTREALRADDVSLSAEALEVFLGRLPKERGVARQEIERLALFIGPGSGAVLGVTELEAFLGVEPDASLFEAANDAFGGRPGPARSGLVRALDEGETGPAAVRAASQHLGRLRRIVTLARSGADMKEAAKSAGVFWKQEREMLRQARSWSLSELDTVQSDLLEADRACKRAGSPDGLIAERALLSVAARARRLGL